MDAITRNWRIILFAVLAASLNLLPLLISPVSGDAVMNYMQIDCFSKQFWSGIFYPRWCVDANGGMGSPGPIFYFPLPFYFAAFFAPLRSLGMSIESHYLLCIWLVNCTAFITCTLWLKKIVRMEVACFAAFIFLWYAYRTDALSRGSYAESWCLALLPLLFASIRELCQNRAWMWPKLAFIIALCLLTHAPMTIIGLMAACVYILWCSPQRIRHGIILATACILAAGMALFHYLPIRILTHTLNPHLGSFDYLRQIWVNNFIDSAAIYKGRPWELSGLCISLMVAALIFSFFWCKRTAISDFAIRRECGGWIIIAIVALLLMFSWSDPLWRWLETITSVRTPWRMAALIMFAVIQISAVMMQYVWQHRPTKTFDAAAASIFFILCSFLYAGSVPQAWQKTYQHIIDSQFTVHFFSTAGTSEIYGADIDRFFAEFIDRPNRRQSEWINGSGDVKVTQWNAHGLRVEGHANQNGTLRLEHFNYPIWQATLNNFPLPITTEKDTGRMLLTVPKGDFSLIISQHYRDMLPPYFWITWLAAFLSLALTIHGFFRLRKTSTMTTRS